MPRCRRKAEGTQGESDRSLVVHKANISKKCLFSVAFPGRSCQTSRVHRKPWRSLGGSSRCRWPGVAERPRNRHRCPRDPSPRGTKGAPSSPQPPHAALGDSDTQHCPDGEPECRGQGWGGSTRRPQSRPPSADVCNGAVPAEIHGGRSSAAGLQWVVLYPVETLHKVRCQEGVNEKLRHKSPKGGTGRRSRMMV